MKISLEWLRAYAPLQAPIADLVATLVDTGTEVDRVNHGPEGVLVARVLTLSPVPESTKGVLLVDIDAGEDAPVQLLTGASNLHVGDLVPWARPGSQLPGWDEPLGVRSMFGGKYSSPGMLCSAVELGAGDDAAGILVLERGTPGQALHEVIALDTVLDVEVTPNRPDCMCHLGLARELAAALGDPLTPPPISISEATMSSGKTADRVSVSVATDLCPRFALRVVEGIRVGPSPEWLQRRLRAIGLRPINNVVDVTNFVTHELGQPLHAFDADRFVAVQTGGTQQRAEVSVRAARSGETLRCLDDVERTLHEDDLVVCAGERVVSLAGVMGGMDTAVVDDTTTILLESAAWDGVAVRATSRRLSLRSDASALFEKGLSDTLVPLALDRAAALIAELAGGHIADGVVDLWPHPLAPNGEIVLSSERLDDALGYHVPLEEAVSVLSRLEFVTQMDNDSLRATPPHFRRDLSIPEDLVEEIGRSLGYDRLPATLPGRRSPIRTLASDVPLDDRVRDLLVGAGFDEAITWSFVPPVLAASLRGLGGDRSPLPLRNPLSEEWSVMRISLLGGLAQAMATNINYGTEHAALFEIGRVFWEGERRGLAAGSTPDGHDTALPPLPAEPLLLGAVMHASDATEAAAALRHLQATVTALATDMGGKLTVVPIPIGEFHPGRAARLWVDDHEVGVIGELNTEVTEQFRVRGRLCCVELRLDGLGAERPRPTRYRQPSRHPAIVQDLAVVVENSIRAGDALAAISEAGGRLLEHAELYDEYRDNRLGENAKGWTFRLTFRAPDRTLTGEEAHRVQEAVAVALRVRCGADLRS